MQNETFYATILLGAFIIVMLWYFAWATRRRTIPHRRVGPVSVSTAKLANVSVTYGGDHVIPGSYSGATPTNFQNLVDNSSLLASDLASTIKTDVYACTISIEIDALNDFISASTGVTPSVTVAAYSPVTLTFATATLPTDVATFNLDTTYPNVVMSTTGHKLTAQLPCEFIRKFVAGEYRITYVFAP